MLPNRSTLITIIALAALFLLLLRAVVPDQLSGTGNSGEERPSIGFLAPDFTGVDVATGQTVKLADLKGKPVLLNFWATWCLPCREEMPILDRLSRDFKGQAHVIAIGADAGESEEVLLNYARQNGLSLTIIRDATGAAARRYQVRAIPASFFIDAAGGVRDIKLGAMNYQTMVDGLKKAGL